MGNFTKEELLIRFWFWIAEITAKEPWLIPTIFFCIAGILLIIAIIIAIRFNKPF